MTYDPFDENDEIDAREVIRILELEKYSENPRSYLQFLQKTNRLKPIDKESGPMLKMRKKWRRGDVLAYKRAREAESEGDRLSVG